MIVRLRQVLARATTWIFVFLVGTIIFQNAPVAKADYFLPTVDQFCNLQTGSFSCRGQFAYPAPGGPPNAAHFNINLRMNFSQNDVQRVIISSFSGDDGINVNIRNGATGAYTAANIFGAAGFNSWCTGPSPFFPSTNIDITSYLVSPTNIVEIAFNDCHAGNIGGWMDFQITGNPTPGAFTLQNASPDATCSSIVLNWTQSVNAANYIVYRDGQAIQVLPSSQRTYSDTTVPIGPPNHSYFVQARNMFGFFNSNTLFAQRPRCVTSLTLTPPGPLSIQSGGSQQFTAVARFNDNTTQDITSEPGANWFVSGLPPVIGTVSGQGFFQGNTLQHGEVSGRSGAVNVRFGTVTATANVQIVPPAPPTVSLLADPARVLLGGKTTLRWSSSNATGLSLNQGIGALTGPNAGVRGFPNGNLEVDPGGSTITYIITAIGPVEDRSAQVTVPVFAAAAAARFEGLFVGNDVAITRDGIQIQYDDRSALVPPPGFANLKLPSLQESF